jgi:hypothetical protein
MLIFISIADHIGGVMVNVLVWSAVDRGFGSNQRLQNCISCFSAKHTALKKKSKDWLARNQDNVSGCDIRGLLFQWASTIKIQLSVLV